MPRFSVVIPCFNAEATLLETLNSLIAQEQTDWEAICVDDGSTDRTARLIEEVAEHDPRIRLERNSGKGPSDARNMGALHLARGDIIAFCDADDLWAPTKLSDVSRAFALPSTDAVFGRVGFFQRSVADVSTLSHIPGETLTIAQLLGENPVCTMSNVAIRRCRFVELGGFDPALVHNEDLEWLIRLIGEGQRIVGFPTVMTYYRMSPNGLSADLTRMAAGRAAALRTAARYGYQPTPADEAIHLRYLARRALRTGAGGTDAARLALRGCVESPAGFFSSPRRGALTLCSAFAALVLPRSTRQFLFAR